MIISQWLDNETGNFYTRGCMVLVSSILISCMKTLFLLAHHISFLPSFSPMDIINGGTKFPPADMQITTADRTPYLDELFAPACSFPRSANNVTWFCLSSYFGFIHIHKLTSYEFLSSVTHFSSEKNIFIHSL